MKRNVTKVPLPDKTFRYEVVITDDDSAENTAHSNFRRREFLQECLSGHGLLDCGSVPFQSLKMTHDGTRWVVVLEAVGP